MPIAIRCLAALVLLALSPALFADGLDPSDYHLDSVLFAQSTLSTGQLDTAAEIAAVTEYDEVVQAGVRRFQERHGLDTDGVVGPATLKALNVSAERRVLRFEVNLERARWVLDAGAAPGAEQRARQGQVHVPKQTYWTAIVREDGKVFFYNDVYQRDQNIADALSEPFRIELPEG